MRITRIFTLIFLLTIAAQAVSAAGVSPGKIDINFFPNQIINIPYTISGYGDFYISDIGCTYLTFNNDTSGTETGEQRFSVTLSLPENMEPGTHDCGFLIKHGQPNEDIPPYAPGGFGAVSVVGTVIRIYVPAEGKYATISLEVNNANRGEPVYFHIIEKNVGSIDLKEQIAIIDIKDNNGNIVKTLYTNPFDVPKFGSTDAWKKMETADIEPAKYTARASVDYGGKEPAAAEAEFLVGKLYVNLISFESNATAGKINPVMLRVQSWWGSPIENVRAEIRLINQNGSEKGSLKTDSTDLNPWQEAVLQGYLDATEIEAGDYKAEIKIMYKGGETNAGASITLHPQPLEVKENNYFGAIESVITSPVFLGILIIMLIINVLMWIIKQKKQDKGKK